MSLETKVMNEYQFKEFCFLLSKCDSFEWFLKNDYSAIMICLYTLITCMCNAINYNLYK